MKQGDWIYSTEEGCCYHDAEELVDNKYANVRILVALSLVRLRLVGRFDVKKKKGKVSKGEGDKAKMLEAACSQHICWLVLGILEE